MNEQCKEIERNNRMGKTRDLFKKIQDTRGTFHPKIDTKKDRRDKHLTETEDTIKRWREYTDELNNNNTQKNLNDLDNHDGVLTHLEPDILECKVKWALGRITMNKANGGDGIAAEVFQILKDDAVKELQSACQQIWKTQQWLQNSKRSVFIIIPKKGNANECPNYCTIVLISHASQVMLKILQVRLQQYMNWELPDVQARSREGRGARDWIANIPWIIEKSKGIPEKLLFLLHWLY